MTEPNTEDNECITLSSTLQNKQPETRTNQTGLTSAAINGILHARLKRAVKERMITVDLIENIRDNGMRTRISQDEKYTIVEIEFMGKHYHGLTSRRPCDEPNTIEAVGRACAKALNELFARERFGDLKKVRVLDESGVTPVTPEIFEAMVRGTD